MSNYLADQYYLEAEKLMDNGEYVEVKKKLEEIIDMEPGYGRAHFRLGWIYWSWYHEYELACQHLRLAIKFSPGFPVSYYTYAYVLNEINHAAALKRHAIHALQVPGVDKAIIHNELGKSFEQNGSITEALHHYKIALMMSVCSRFTERITDNLERAESKIKSFSVKSLFTKEVVC